MPERTLDLAHNRFLFHYTTRDAAFEHIVPKGQLRFSRYFDMRDPLENKNWRLNPGGWGEATPEVRKEQAEGFLTFQRLAEKIRERSFLLSMTKDADPALTGEDEFFSRGWARARMWEQYAENHSGVCLAFDRLVLEDLIGPSLREQGFAPPYHRDVEYNGSGMMKPMLSLSRLAQGVTPKDVAAYVEENWEVLFFHKALDWATEHEYRFATIAKGDRSHLFVDYGDALAGIIVSEKFPVWQRPGALQVCEAHGIAAMRLDWSMGAPAIVQLRPIRGRSDEIREQVESLGSAPPAAEPPPAS